MNNISNISFSSGIYFLPKKELRTMVYASYQGPRSNFTAIKPDVKEVFEGGIDAVKDLGTHSKGFTAYILHCIAGVFKEGKSNKMFHFYPPDFSVSKGKAQEEVKKINPEQKLKGLIIGGLHSSEEYCKTESKQSLRLLANLDIMFKKFKEKDFSIFFGQKNNIDYDYEGIDFLHDAAEDNYFIHLDLDEVTPEIVKKHFHFIKISPSDNVFVKGQKIDPKLIET
jgi:hypothetical protein